MLLGSGTKKSEPKNEQKALPYDRCMAKIIEQSDGRILKGANVETHCKITGLVADELIKNLPGATRDELFPKGTNLVVAVHDTGKINPMFQEKIHRLLKTDYHPNSLPELKYAKPEHEANTGYHSGASMVTLASINKSIAEIAGRHHGTRPVQATGHLAEDEVYGGIPWNNERKKLLEALKQYFSISSWPEIRNELQTGVLCGLTTVSDWIGSGEIFDYAQMLDDHELRRLVEVAVKQAGFSKPKIREGLSFGEVFEGFSLRDSQRTLIDNIQKPGLYILEAPMGEGKTEAALYAAYACMERGDASGIYFALPTQLTSNMIYMRMESFLENILDPSEEWILKLIHGNSWLFDTEMGGDGKTGSSWFDTRKRSLLAPFGVGTLDQALMGLLNVKHNYVRLFGLIGKVVIIDEVHSYDAYTGTILDNLTQSLRNLNCTVILLSATLASSRKLALVGKTEIPYHPTDAYPMVTNISRDGHTEEVVFRASSRKTMKLRITTDDEEAMNEAFERSLDGEQVLWLENTVRESQNRYKKFAAWASSTGIETGLMHSRFPACIRTHLDSYWVGIYGKHGGEKRSLSGRILVGTQVLEQSLDIDSDFLVSRIAPSDMILQRLGRVWRHEETKRPDHAEAHMVIISPDFEKCLRNPKYSFGPTGAVYSPYVLVRSYEVLQNISKIRLPEDVRNIIENTYEERVETGALANAKQEIMKTRNNLSKQAFNGLSQVGISASDTAPTRISDIPTCNVLILHREPNIDTGIVIFFDGTKIQLPLDTTQVKTHRKFISKQIMEHLIPVPEYLAPIQNAPQEIEWLKPYIYIKDQKTRIAILQSSGTITGYSGRIASETYDLSYTEILGYCAEKKEGEWNEDGIW